MYTCNEPNAYMMLGECTKFMGEDQVTLSYSPTGFTIEEPSPVTHLEQCKNDIVYTFLRLRFAYIALAVTSGTTVALTAVFHNMQTSQPLMFLPFIMLYFFVAMGSLCGMRTLESEFASANKLDWKRWNKIDVAERPEYLITAFILFVAAFGHCILASVEFVSGLHHDYFLIPCFAALPIFALVLYILAQFGKLPFQIYVLRRLKQFIFRRIERDSAVGIYNRNVVPSAA